MRRIEELLKTILLMLIFLFLVIYGESIFMSSNKVIIVSIGGIIILIIIYLFSLNNDLKQVKNEYNNDINIYSKQYKKQLEKTKRDLEKRGMTFSGEAKKKLGTMSAYGGEIKGELEINKEDYVKYRTKKFKLDFQKAKYKVLIN